MSLCLLGASHSSSSMIVSLSSVEMSCKRSNALQRPVLLSVSSITIIFTMKDSFAIASALAAVFVIPTKACKPHGGLAYASKRGMSEADICAESFSDIGYYAPYTCTKGAKGACCSIDADVEVDLSTWGQGTCTKMTDEAAVSSTSAASNTTVSVASTGTTTTSSPHTCKPHGGVGYASNRGMTASAVCTESFNYLGFTVPYTCEKGANYACCSSTTADSVDLSMMGQGECFKMTVLSSSTGESGSPSGAPTNWSLSVSAWSWSEWPL